MAILRISTTPEKKILIEPIGEIDRDDWSVVISWWSQNKSQVDQNCITISAADFAYRKLWLR
jgi:hypothetical protein